MDVVKGQERYQCEVAASYCYEYHCSWKLGCGRYNSEIKKGYVMHVQVMTANGQESNTAHNCEIGGGMGMCGELQALAVLSVYKVTSCPMNRQLSGTQHTVR